MTARPFRAALTRSMIGFTFVPAQDEKRNIARVSCRHRRSTRDRRILHLEFLHTCYHPTCRPNTLNACRAMTLFQLLSSGALRVMREFAANGDLLLADAVRRVIGAAVRSRFSPLWLKRRMKKQRFSIATLDSRRFQLARSDFLCLHPKRWRLFPARYLDSRRS